ncbi:efflux transporter outer membrane subunit [Vibrio sp. MEBiC08052]|uniref:efflux transporter outer membrane subunit n=1 Tax=Vibrio sp. MEBiC08052 TaxID=1761910 RepID=UPI0007407B58|nr:efflux transporter outer membrane subunit [Vibrio sp. MEBiC08052]KUJ00663.1 NodT family RND efflux system outer membrane lipoprotein [Vibrio sp. MEBiC08052]
MKNLLKCLSIAITLILCGCAAPNNIQPKNHLADQSVLAHSHQLNHPKLSPANWPAQTWWQSLGDTQLEHLIQTALNHSPTMQLADANLVNASAMVMAANAQFDPTLSATAGATRSRLSRSEDSTLQGNRYGTLYTLGLTGNYAFDLWGGNRDVWEATVNNQLAAEIDHQAAKITLSTAIVQTYIQLSNAYALQDLAQQDLQRTQRIVDITQRLLKNGLTSEDRLYTAQSSTAAAKQILKKRSLTISQLKNALATLVGQGPDIATTIQRPSIQMETALSLPQNLPASLLSHRPDIVAAKWRIEAMSKEIDAARTRFYPNVNLSFWAGFKAMLGDAVFEDVSRSWRVGPAISLPLFTRDLKANLIEKTAGYDRAVAHYNDTLIKALGEVSDNVLIIKSIALQIKDAQQSMRLADKSYHITEKRYEAGMGSHLEVLLAEQQLIQAESSFTQLKNQQQEQQVHLIRSLGGGFHDSSPNDHLTTTAN